MPLHALSDLERAAGADDVVAFQDAQFALWQDLRRQGNPWRITDFVTVGAPLAQADLLVTRPGLFNGFRKSDRAERRSLFDALIRRGALVRCPPRTETQPVEGDEEPARYGVAGAGAREVLGSLAPFAVTRWTNLWFPVRRGGLRGDWFGGELRPLFGRGIRDVVITGNLPGRLARGTAHNDYFDYPEQDGEGDVARQLRATLALQTHDVLEELLTAPPPDPSTRTRRPHHQCWRSDSWLLE